MPNGGDTRTEKQVEHAGDLFMVSLGASIIRFSMARATMQTPGIPDRRYYLRLSSRQNALGSTEAPGVHTGTRTCALWWEAKRVGGIQSQYQKMFQETCTLHGETYLVGTDDVLHEWALTEGLVRRLPNGWEILR